MLKKHLSFKKCVNLKYLSLSFKKFLNFSRCLSLNFKEYLSFQKYFNSKYPSFKKNSKHSHFKKYFCFSECFNSKHLSFNSNKYQGFKESLNFSKIPSLKLYFISKANSKEKEICNSKIREISKVKVREVLGILKVNLKVLNSNLKAGRFQ